MSEGRLSQEPLTLEGVEKSGFSFFGEACEMLISKSFSKKYEPALLHGLQG